MNGFLDDFKDQLTALETIYHHALVNIPLENWTFGGGTALSLFYFRHRMSYDIDIFVNDPQYFAFLSPKWYVPESNAFHQEYTELAHQISLTTETGIKVDLLLAPRITGKFPDLKTVAGIQCYVDPVQEIIAKKLRRRFTDLRTSYSTWSWPGSFL